MKKVKKRKYSISGKVLLSLGYIDGDLVVYVNKARKLAAAHTNGRSNPYITICILTEDNKFFHKKNTDTKKKTLKPLFRESFKVN